MVGPGGAGGSGGSAPQFPLEEGSYDGIVDSVANDTCVGLAFDLPPVEVEWTSDTTFTMTDEAKDLVTTCSYSPDGSLVCEGPPEPSMLPMLTVIATPEEITGTVNDPASFTLRYLATITCEGPGCADLTFPCSIDIVATYEK